MLEAVAGADGLAGDDDSGDDETTPALDGPKVTGSIPQWLRTPTQHTLGSEKSQAVTY